MGWVLVEVHAVVVCTVVLMLQRLGRAEALDPLDRDAAKLVRRGHLRTLPAAWRAVARTGLRPP